MDSSLNEFITIAIKIDNLMRNTTRSRRFVSASPVQAQSHPDTPECFHTPLLRGTRSLSASTIELPNPKQHSFLLECELSVDTTIQCVLALVDSGSAVNVINQELTDKLKICTSPCVPTINKPTIDNDTIGSGITATTQPITLHVGLFHKETITFYVVPSCKYQVILGHPWLAIQDPSISWNHGELTKWS